MVPGFHHERAIAGYTDPFLFLFERTSHGASWESRFTPEEKTFLGVLQLEVWHQCIFLAGE